MCAGVGVAITTGIDVGTNALPGHLRFGYTNSIERLQEGVCRIGEFLAADRTDIFVNI